MIEFGVIEEVFPGTAKIVVYFEQLDTRATCDIITPATGNNVDYNPPPKGTQVACWLESGKNIAFGCLFSEIEKVPENIDDNTKIQKFGKTTIVAKDDSWKVSQDKIALELTNNKASLKNDSIGLKTILKDLFALLKTYKSSNAAGVALPMPPTIQKIVQLEQETDQLFND